MNLNRRTSARLLLALVWLFALPAMAADWALSALAPHFPTATQVERFRLEPGAKSVRRIDLGEADADEIAAVRQANTEQFTKRLQIGIGRRAPSRFDASSESLRWTPVDGGIAAQWEIVSSGARALRIALAVAHLSPGAQMRFSGSGDGDRVYGPYSSADVAKGESAYWSPVLEGERAIVEVFVPGAGSPGDVSLSISWISHLFVSPTDAHVEKLAKAAGACEVDLICRSASDTALANVGKAVAKMTLSDGVGGGTGFCTGTLLTTTAGAIAPYFFTAAHCISTQAGASTLTTHWFYDRTGCGTGGTNASNVQVTGGSTLLYASTATDVSFLRLAQNPPGGAVYAGWDASTLSAGTALTAVHHPDGDLKKVSLGSVGGFSGYSGASGDDHVIALWNSTATGVTEGGSSGSGLFTAIGQPASDYQLRGGLHGGPSSCSATGADLRDYYSRFDRAYPFLAQYLNPSTSCTYTLSPASASVGSAASSGSFSVSTGSGCTWSAASTATWLTTSSSGSGSGTVTYSVAANTGSARTGTITVGGQSFTVSQQAAAGGSATNVIGNGGFENGSSSWTQAATSGFPIISTGASDAHSGSGFAWLGGYVSGTDSLYQDVTIPAGSSSVTLQYWYRIVTAETVPGSWDTLQVVIQSPTTGATLATVASYSNQNATSGWVRSPAYNLAAYAGQTIRLRFTAVNDATNISSFLVDDIEFMAASAGSGSANYTALWWNPAESGWGVNFSHQDGLVFGTLFTYDSTGAPLWLVMPAGAPQSDGVTFAGTLYRTTGSPFNANPFSGAIATAVGTMAVSFGSSGNTAGLVYEYNGVTVSKSIQRQVFGTRSATCLATSGSRASLTNYQDLWWNSAESGWGVNLTQQATSTGETIFATLFTYDSAGKGLWLVLADGARQSDGSFFGTLYQTTGSPFNANPFAGAIASPVGTMRFRFTSGEAGTLVYTYNGVSVTKSITRQVIRNPVGLPACSS